MPTIISSAPAKVILFGEHGVNRQQPALATAIDLRLTCRLTTRSDSMNLNQLLLEKLGVCHPRNERLIEAALAAGALGAKIAGSGGGGIIIALCTPDSQAAVAAAIDAAGGRSLVTTAGCPGVRIEQSGA